MLIGIRVSCLFSSLVFLLVCMVMSIYWASLMVGRACFSWLVFDIALGIGVVVSLFPWFGFVSLWLNLVYWGRCLLVGV